MRDVFVPRGLSQVPLAPPEVAGLLNLRGRIVTAIDLRRHLGLPPGPTEARRWRSASRSAASFTASSSTGWAMCSGKRSSYDANPVNLDRRWAKVCAGVHRLDHGLMVVLDVDKVLDLKQFGVAA